MGIKVKRHEMLLKAGEEYKKKKTEGVITKQVEEVKGCSFKPKLYNHKK